MQKLTITKKILGFGIAIVAIMFVLFFILVNSFNILNKKTDSFTKNIDDIITIHKGIYELQKTTSKIVQAINSTNKSISIENMGDHAGDPIGILLIYKDLEPDIKKFFSNYDKIYQLLLEGKNKEAENFFYTDTQAIQNSIISKYSEMEKEINKQKDLEMGMSKKIIRYAINISLVLGIVLVLLFSSFTLFIRSSLKHFAKELVSLSDILLSGVTEISKGNQDLSSRTQTQSGTLSEISSETEKISSTVTHTADNAITGTILAQSAADKAKEGDALSIQTKTAMDQISESSHKIAEIVNLVNEIAFQTNILAINAAIEAAKAGEQGKGFAVVAIEVRSLAQRSAGAAMEIKDLISESMDRVTTGNKLAGDNAIKFNELALSIKAVYDIINEISFSSNELCRSTDQIKASITGLDAATQQNAALVEQIASSSEQISSEAERMNDLIRQNI